MPEKRGLDTLEPLVRSLLQTRTFLLIYRVLYRKLRLLLKDELH